VNAVTNLAPATVRIWGTDQPVKVEQYADGWWIAEPVENPWGYYGSSKFSAGDAVDRLITSAEWHRRAA
jgi:hypothetical protein